MGCNCGLFVKWLPLGIVASRGDAVGEFGEVEGVGAEQRAVGENGECPIRDIGEADVQCGVVLLGEKRLASHGIGAVGG